MMGANDECVLFLRNIADAVERGDAIIASYNLKYEALENYLEGAIVSRREFIMIWRQETDGPPE